jgi:predicted nucleotidyltransferase
VTDFRRLLLSLADAHVDFIVVGGVAAAAHGAARTTLDLDIVYRRTPENITRLVGALRPHHPYLRGAPPGLPFLWDEQTISNGLNFTLITDLGEIDLLGEIVAGGGFESLVLHSVELALFGHRFRCISLPELIRVKRAAGRPKDFEALAELEKLLELSRR